MAELRVGIMCSGTSFQHWQADAIRHILQVPGVRIVLLIVDARSPDSANRPRAPLRQLPYRKYREHFFKPKAMASVDLAQELGQVPVLRVIPEMDRKKERFNERDLHAIAAYSPHILLRFAFNILGGGILSIAEHGVWSFHHGDETEYRGGPPGLWEIMDGAPVTGAVLQRLTERLDGGSILRKGWFPTIDHSLEETVDRVLSCSAIWPAQVMRQLLSGDAGAAGGVAPEKLGRIRRYPNETAFILFLWRLFRNKIRFHRRELNEHEEWNIGVLYQPIGSLLKEEPDLNIRWLPPPSPDNFRADPFGYKSPDGTLNVLYEKFDHPTGKGDISKVRPKKDGVLKRSRTMLRLDTHLSYPYVIEHEGRIYVVPENAAGGSVVLYELNEGNDGLDRVATLLNEPLIDPTIFRAGDHWWMFGTKAPLSNVALHVYYSSHLQGPYLPHPQNPVKFDIRSARPAGTPFVHEGGLWRPGQDSSVTYGGRIALNRVTVLDPWRFQEETVKFIGPFKGTMYDQGLHTIAAVGDITLVDGKRIVTVAQRKAAVRDRKLRKLKLTERP